MNRLRRMREERNDPLFSYSVVTRSHGNLAIDGQGICKDRP